MVVDDCLRHLDFVDLANRCRKSKGNTHEPVSFKVATIALYFSTDLRTCRREWYPSRTWKCTRVAPSRHRRVTDRDLCVFMTRISTQASSFAAMLQLRSSINMARPRRASLISNFFFLRIHFSAPWVQNPINPQLVPTNPASKGHILHHPRTWVPKLLRD